MWGDDFAHSNATLTYEIMDKVIEVFNSENENYSYNIEIEYSSMDKFLTDVYEEGKRNEVKWPVRTEDFWEYTMGSARKYWSGYFTSDPQFKREVVSFSNAIHTHQLITSLNT